MSVPGTALAISFNALFAEAPCLRTGEPRWPASAMPPYALASIVDDADLRLVAQYVAVSLWAIRLCSSLAFIGATMSTVHLFYRPPGEDAERSNGRMRLRDWAEPGIMHTWNSVRTTVGLRFLMRKDGTQSSQPNRWLAPMSDDSYKSALLLVFAMHLTLIPCRAVVPVGVGARSGVAGQYHRHRQQSVLCGSVHRVAAA